MKALAACLALMMATPAQADNMTLLISQYRRAHGLSTVRSDVQLTTIAQRQANAMASRNVLDHALAGTFQSRLSEMRVNSAAENIAVGTKTWGETLRIWKASSSHNANLLRQGATDVGVAVAHSGKPPHQSFWVMVIANKSADRRPQKLRASGARRL